MSIRRGQGPAKPIALIGADDLVENGGNFSLQRGPAEIVYGIPSENISSTKIIGGKPVPVYLLQESDLKENGGTWKVTAGPAEPIAISGNYGNSVSGHVAIPVFAINLDNWISPVKYIGDATGLCAGSALTINVSGLAMETNFLMIASIVYEGSDSETITAPPGWITVYEEYESGQGWLGIYYDFYDGTDAHAWSFSDASACYGGISVYECVDTNTPIDTVGVKNQGNSNAPTASSIKPNKKGTKLIQFVGASGSPTWEPDQNWIKRWQKEKVSNGDKGHKSGNTGDVESTLNSAAVWQSVMIAVTPCNSISVSGTVDLRLSWTDNSDNETGFLIQRGPDGSSWTTIAVLNENISTWDDLNVDGNQTVYYRVLAYNDDGNSDPSNTVSVTIS